MFSILAIYADGRNAMLESTFETAEACKASLTELSTFASEIGFTLFCVVM